MKSAILSTTRTVLFSVLAKIFYHHLNVAKMFTRRNWLLRCSILINIAVILYICSHVMIGGGGNFANSAAFLIQDESGSSTSNNNNNNNNNLNIKLRQVVVSNIIDKNLRSEISESLDDAAKLNKKEFENSLKTVEIHASDEKVQQQQPQQVQEVDDDPIMHLANKDTALQQGSGNQQQLPSQPEHTNEFEQNQRETSGADDIQTELNEFAVQEKSQNEIAGQPDIVPFVNTSNTDGYVTNGDEKEFDERLRTLLKCHDRDYKPEIIQRGDFWVLKNYVTAEHGQLKCHETITYTTHADYTFLDNLIPLLERWNSPVSIAIHAPGNDFQPTTNAIKYLRDCLPESNLVRQFVTFHIYFSTKHIPKTVPKSDKLFDQQFNCTGAPPFVNVSNGHLYKTQKKLLYPVNVGRNIARDAAQTYFILASDIELYPNPGLVKKFLEMIARNDAYLQRSSPRVFPLPIFEVESSVPVPKDKTELQELLRINKAIPFHKRVCSSCHGVPKSKEWMVANETEELGVFHIGKRVGYFVHWEPIYIGTHADPHYDERLSWEGKSDKMTQGYALCVLDYEFQILDNAFLVHKPGIKVLKKDPRRAMLAAKTNQLIKKMIYPELRVMYGTRKGCAV